jgi:hypothetical protein
MLAHATAKNSDIGWWIMICGHRGHTWLRGSQNGSQQNDGIHRVAAGDFILQKPLTATPVQCFVILLLEIPCDAELT